MKKTALLMLVTTFGFAPATLQAGETVSAKAPPPPPIEVPSLCDCFDAGKCQISLYGAGIIFDSGPQDDELGGGLSVSYFFTENVGLEADATWLATDEVLHHFTGSVVVRFPIRSICVAPYLLGGGGIAANSENEGTLHVGGGIDVRCGKSRWCPGLFADARYTWTEDNHDFALIRAGFRFNL
jgi:hypothetical protein